MPSRSHSFAWTAAACIVGLGLPSASSAAEPWLEVESSARCSASAAPLEAAIRSRVAGDPNAELRVKVTLSDAPARAARGALSTRARIDVALGAESLSIKRLEASTCAEAIEAVVVVVALALSTELLPRAALPGPSAAPVAGDPAKALEFGSVEQPRRSESVAARDALRLRRAAARTADFKLSLSLIADSGTLSEPTLLVGTGAALPLDAGELRSALWYALPSVREEELLGVERTHTDYVGGALGYCRGVDAGEWLSACAGLELGLVRRFRELELPGQTRTEQEQISPRLAAALGLTFAYRDAPLEPAFDFSAQAPLLGRLAAAPRVGLRAGLSAGLRF